MLSIFSYVCWPSVCLLWRNVYLGLPSIFFIFYIELHEFLYIFEINPLSVAWFANIPSHSEGCLFILLMISFAVQKLLSLIRLRLFIFVFIFITLEGGSKKILLRFMSKSVLLMFSSKSFIVSGLTFRSKSILSLFLCMMVGNVLISPFYMQLFSFPSTSYWRDCIFSIIYSCLDGFITRFFFCCNGKKNCFLNFSFWFFVASV